MTTFGMIALAAFFAFGFCGWVAPIREGNHRFTFRYLACGALTACTLAAANHNWDQRRWLLLAVDVCATWYAIGRTTYWWRKAEAVRP